MTSAAPVGVPLVRTLEPPSEGDEIVSLSVSPAGEAVAMWASAVDRARLFVQEHTGRGVFPRPHPETPVVVRLTVDTPHVRRAVVPLKVETNFPTAHLLPEGRILVVGARARWRPEGPEHNGYVYSVEGALERSACLGDGIERVMTTARGFIWIGYFDEGVFGNLGWGGPGPAPIGPPGLNRFDATLGLQWSNPDSETCDCYALAISEEECLACPYTDWPVMRVTEAGELQLFGNRVEGATALVEHRGRLALVGGYDDERNRVVVGSLRGHDFRVEATGRLALPGTTSWKPSPVIGRDGVLHAFDGAAWHTITLGDLSRALVG